MFLVLLELSAEEVEEFRGIISVATHNATPPFKREFIEKLYEAIADAEANS